MACARKHVSVYMFSFYFLSCVLREERDRRLTWLHRHSVSSWRYRVVSKGHLLANFIHDRSWAQQKRVLHSSWLLIWEDGEKVTFLSSAVICLSFSKRNSQTGWFYIKGVCELTDCHRVVDFEAAENLVDVSGLEEAVTSHHNLKRLWFKDIRWHYFPINWPKDIFIQYSANKHRAYVPVWGRQSIKTLVASLHNLFF